MKNYVVYRAGSTEVARVFATCITKAVKKFIETLDCAATYGLDSREQAGIRCAGNHTVMRDYIVMEV